MGAAVVPANEEARSQMSDTTQKSGSGVARGGFVASAVE